MSMKEREYDINVMLEKINIHDEKEILKLFPKTKPENITMLVTPEGPITLKDFYEYQVAGNDKEKSINDQIDERLIKLEDDVAYLRGLKSPLLYSDQLRTAHISSISLASKDATEITKRAINEGGNTEWL